MTLLTDRRSFQTKNLERIAQNADYFAQRRGSTYWQPELEPGAARLAGFEEVWSDADVDPVANTDAEPRARN